MKSKKKLLKGNSIY